MPRNPKPQQLMARLNLYRAKVGKPSVSEEVINTLTRLLDWMIEVDQTAQLNKTQGQPDERQTSSRNKREV